MYRVETDWYRSSTRNGKTTSKKVQREDDDYDWPDSVGRVVATFLEIHDKIVFSGMEDFGEGECVLNEDHNCQNPKHKADCRAHHVESVRQWVEKRTDELREKRPGDEEDASSFDLCFSLGAKQYGSITVTYYDALKGDGRQDLRTESLKQVIS